MARLQPKFTQLKITLDFHPNIYIFITMKTNPEQAAEEEATTNENNLRVGLEAIELEIIRMGEKRNNILIELGKCLVARIDAE